MAQYTDEFASVRAKMYALNKAHIINTSDEADVPYVGTSGEPMPSRPVTTLTPAAFSFTGMSIGSNNKHSILGLKGGAKRTVNVMLDDETPSFYSNNQTGGFANEAVEDELMGGSSCGCQGNCGCSGGAQFRARTDTGLLPRGFINKTNIQSGGFESINHRVPNYRNSGSNLNAIGEAATLGYGHEGISSSSTNSAMNVMILQDPYDKSVPAYNPTQIFSPTAAYDMTASDFKGVHGSGYAGGMIGLPFKIPDMEKKSSAPECEEILQRPTTKEVRPTKYNGKMYDNPMSAKNAKLYDQCVARQGRSSPEIEEMDGAGVPVGAGTGPSKERERAPQPKFTFTEKMKKAITTLKGKLFTPGHIERVKVFVTHRPRGEMSDMSLGEDTVKDAYMTILEEYKKLPKITLAATLSETALKDEVTEMNLILSSLEGKIQRLKKMPTYQDDLSGEQRNFVDEMKSRLPVMREMLQDVQEQFLFLGSAKPMPDSEPENDEDLKKALRGMGLPAQ